MVRCTILMLSLFISIIAASTNSDALQNLGPETISLKNGTLPLQFMHRKHQNLNNSECFQCHAEGKWKMDNWGKELAHSMCISCHDLNDKGPVKCEDCHK